MQPIAKLCLVFISLFTLAPLLAQNAITDYQLDNGLKIIVKQDTRAPVALSILFYKVGSSYEPGGITGVSHVLEHMMFKGTPTHPTGDYTQIVASLGGELNALTDFDITAYYNELTRDHLATSFELEADRMQNLIFSEAEFTNELKVVQEEYRMRYGNNPQAMVYERFLAAAHLQNPYHHSPIGWFNDLENMQVGDVTHWYQQYYTPNNAILVVVGDVNPDEIYQLAEKAFGDIPSKILPTIKPQREPPPLGTRSLTITIPAELPFLMMGYNTPSLVTIVDDQDAYALTTLAIILAGSNSARLPKNLVRGQQQVSYISVDYDPYKQFDNLFTIEAIPAANHSLKEVKEAILSEIERVQTEPITARELAIVKTQVRANNVYQQDSLFDQAFELGLTESIGLPWQVTQTFAQRIDTVTPEQIQAVAKKYLIPERLTIAELIPSPPPTRGANED